MNPKILKTLLGYSLLVVFSLQTFLVLNFLDSHKFFETNIVLQITLYTAFVVSFKLIIDAILNYYE